MASKEDLHRIVDQLGESEADQAMGLLVALLRDKLPQVPGDLDDETNVWLEADLAPPLPPYDWGPKGPPPGKPVSYVPGVGLVVEGGK